MFFLPMLAYNTLSKRPKHFHRLTGLTLPEFDQVFDKFVSAWNEYLAPLKNDPTRKRKYGGGRHAEIATLRDKLLFILVYVRMYPLLFLQGIMFGISEGNACVWVHRLLSVLDKALGYTHTQPKRGQGKTLEELLIEFPELKELGILGDGVERPTRRPKNEEKQKKRYSGKKKRHSRKNVILTNPNTTAVLYLSTTQDGAVHDKRALDEEKLETHIPVKLGADLGFEGLEIPGAKVVLPIKKPPKKELSDEQKYLNTTFARRRIRVEHAIAGVKRNRSVADIYRNVKEGTDDLFMTIACSLHNLRVACRYASG